MGTDIELHIEEKVNGVWHLVEQDPNNRLFDWRNYGMYAFLAGVKNYSAIEPISKPRDIPDDISPELRKIVDENLGHSASWLTIKELKDFDYNQTIEDRRYTKQIIPTFSDGGATCEPGQGTKMPLSEFLCESYFKQLNEFVDGEYRIVFWFDC